MKRIKDRQQAELEEAEREILILKDEIFRLEDEMEHRDMSSKRIISTEKFSIIYITNE